GHQAGAGEGREQAAGLDYAQRELVHVQVLLQRGDDLVAVAGHLGRVQDHHVVAVAPGGRIAQPREDIRLHETRAHAAVEGHVELRIGPGDLDHVGVDVHADHLAGATRGRVHGETASVA